MTTVNRYSREFLISLRPSPLCTKPDKLPPKDELEKWMGVRLEKEDQNGRGVKSPLRPDESLSDPISRLGGQMRTANRRNQDGDFILGPPKMGFTSNNRNTTRSEDKRSERQGDFTDGFFKPATDGGRERTRKPRESVDDSTSGRRTGQVEEGANRWGGRDDRRERKDPLDVPLRRNGVGRGLDPWSAGEGAGGGSRSDRNERNDVRSIPWRERDSKQPWARGSKLDAPNDDQPEWMNDSPVVAENEAQKRTEDFQKWKEEQKAKELGSKKDSKDEKREAPPAKPPTMSLNSATLLPTLGMFGNYEESEKTDDGMWLKKPQTKSRFDTIFQKQEPITSPNPLPSQLQQLQQPQQPQPPQQPQQPLSRPLSTGNENGNAEDRAGFDRILAMLNKSTPTPKPNEQVRPPPPPQEQAPRSPDRGIEDLLARQLANNRLGGPLGQQNQEQINQNAQRDFLFGLMTGQQLPPNQDFGPLGNGPLGQQQQQMMNQRNAPSAPPGLNHHHMMNQKRQQPPPPGAFPFFDQDGLMQDPNMPPSGPPGLNRRNTDGHPGQVQIPGQGPPNAAPPQASNLGIPSFRMNSDMPPMRNNPGPGPGPQIPHDGRIPMGPPPPGLHPGPPMPNMSNGNHHPSRSGGPQGGRQPNGNGMPPFPPGFPHQGMPPPHMLPGNGSGGPPFMGPPPGFFGPGGPGGPLGMGPPPGPPMGGAGGPMGPPPGFFGPGRFFDGPQSGGGNGGGGPPPGMVPPGAAGRGGGF